MSKPPASRLPVDPDYLRDLFSRSARTYDPINLVISWGQVERWRRQLVDAARIRPDDRVLDAFSGPGSLARHALRMLGADGELVLADLSPVMLKEARQALAPVLSRRSDPPRVRYLAVNMLSLGAHVGLAPAGFDVVMCGFGLRYVPDVPVALARLSRYVAPGGCLALLEFTVPERRPSTVLRSLLPSWYFARLLPWWAGALSGEREIYDYLRDSTRRFLSPSRLEAAIEEAGLHVRAARTFLGGMVSLFAATPAPPG